VLSSYRGRKGESIVGSPFSFTCNLNTGGSSMDVLVLSSALLVVGICSYILGRSHEREVWKEEIVSLRGRLNREVRRLSSRQTR
jgi:hypothetical protein